METKNLLGLVPDEPRPYNERTAEFLLKTDAGIRLINLTYILLAFTLGPCTSYFRRSRRHFPRAVFYSLLANALFFIVIRHGILRFLVLPGYYHVSQSDIQTYVEMWEGMNKTYFSAEDSVMMLFAGVGGVATVLGMYWVSEWYFASEVGASRSPKKIGVVGEGKKA